MEQLPTPTIDMSAVELHRPPDELIEELEAMAARYERSFLVRRLGKLAMT